MISYGISVQGKGHKSKGVVCQDSNTTKKLSSGHYIAIVADGVGSAKHSDVGSNLAVEKLCEYCEKHIDKKATAEQIRKVLFDGYAYAYNEELKYSEKKQIDVSDLDTTLSSVIYNGKNVVFGHAGDGGIIVKLSNGIVVPITKRQKGVDGVSVRPLRAGESSWEFGVVEDVIAVLLSTDGILDGVFQPVLINLPANYVELAKGNSDKNNVYITAAEFFMNPYSVYKNKRIKNPNEYIRHFVEAEYDKNDQDQYMVCLASIYLHMFDKKNAVKICSGNKKIRYLMVALNEVSDDKSISCLINDKAKQEICDVEYYVEPNWSKMQQHYNELLYGKNISPKIEKKPKEKSLIDSEEKVDRTNDDGFQDDYPIDRKKRFHLPRLSVRKGFIIAFLVATFIAVGCIVFTTFFLDYGKGDDVRVENHSLVVSKQIIDSDKNQMHSSNNVDE